MLEEFDWEHVMKSIPNQMAFKIGDVAHLLGLKPHVLRYWEEEFRELRPKKSINNQRIYSQKDVQVAILIKKLLHGDRFSIPGAKKALEENKGIWLGPPKKSSKTEEFNPDFPQKFIQIENRMEQLISKIKSARGKIEHSFSKMGL